MRSWDAAWKGGISSHVVSQGSRLSQKYHTSYPIKANKKKGGRPSLDLWIQWIWVEGIMKMDYIIEMINKEEGPSNSIKRGPAWVLFPRAQTSLIRNIWSKVLDVYGAKSLLNFSYFLIYCFCFSYGKLKRLQWGCF